MKNKKNNKKGFTLAELLIVIAIIIILSGLGFIAVTRYLRVLRHLEYDNVAKEMFITAQNHLSMAKNEGYLETNEEGFGHKEGSSDIYYFVVNNSSLDQLDANNSALKVILPFASIDETIRSHGSYIIRYQKSSGKILDVFYSKESDSRFGASFVYDDGVSGKEVSYSQAMDTKDSDGSNKATRRDYTNGQIIGWYGGEVENDIGTVTVTTPNITISNGDVLKVSLTNINRTDGETIRLVIKGVDSNANAYIDYDGAGTTAEYILDDITTESNKFYNIGNRFTMKTGSSFIPGENLNIQVVAFSTDSFSNVAFSEEKICNSLFEDGSDVSKVLVSNFRHLENLDATISKYNPGTEEVDAKQLTDLSWGKTESLFKDGSYSYIPISVAYTLNFDGDNHNIANMNISEISKTGNYIGLFGQVTGGSIKNVRLVDIDVSPTLDVIAGGLVGETNATEISNAIVYLLNDGYNTDSINGATVGGLIGKMISGSVVDSAAAIKVNGSIVAGGLIGESVNGSVANSYSGGHTYGGKYTINTMDNVYAPTAGGLIGKANGTSINGTYSTCSVRSYGSANTAGGLVGDLKGTIKNSYALGKVTGTTAGSLVGTADSSSTYNGCKVLEVVNYSNGNSMRTIGNNASDPIEITAIDSNLAKYNEWLGTNYVNKNAHVYDKELAITDLNELYNGKYAYRTISQLTNNSKVDEHYGDFPAYEAIAIND